MIAGSGHPPRLLFVSPALPRPTGSGLRMRAWQFLLGLSRRHAVTLVAGSPHFPAEDAEASAHLEPLVDELLILPWSARRDPELLLRRLMGASGLPRDWARPTRAMRRRLDPIARRPFQRVHVFRLYMLPLALAVLRGDAAAIDSLDFDDWESETRRALSALPPLPAVRRLAREAEAYARLEGEWLRRLARVAVCSEADHRRLRDRYPSCRFHVVPNAVPVPGMLPPPAYGSALRFLLGEVLPPLRRRHPDLLLTVVGSGAPRWLRRRMHTTPGARWLGAVDSLEDCYAEAWAAVAPLRAGGGTRLKVLEAFARGRPVVSSAAGVGGLELEPGHHYLAAEDAGEFVAACDRLIRNAALAARIRASAFEWVRGHSLELGVDAAEALLDGALG